MDFTPDLGDPDGLLAYMAPPLRAVRSALDHGSSWATTLLARSPLSHDRHFWRHAARYQAREYLASLPKVGWELGRMLPNTGIELLQGPVVVRVLSGYDGGPPNPGHSRARRRYYLQYTPEDLLGLEWSDGAKLTTNCNLILHWDVGAKKEILLGLSKTNGVWEFNSPAHLEWTRTVVFDSSDEPRFDPQRDEFLGDEDAEADDDAPEAE